MNILNGLSVRKASLLTVATGLGAVTPRLYLRGAAYIYKPVAANERVTNNTNG
jgi:hypothetical protein